MCYSKLSDLFLLNSPSHDASHPNVCAKKRGKITDISLHKQGLSVFFDSFLLLGMPIGPVFQSGRLFWGSIEGECLEINVKVQIAAGRIRFPVGTTLFFLDKCHGFL